MKKLLSRSYFVVASLLVLFRPSDTLAQQTGPGYALNFNGTNQNAYFTRSISNDFTIEFWFKSTQVAGSTNQWYQGMGLVDGEVNNVTADFGVTLGNGKVLFGIGSPDSTVAATNTVTDGAWHHVAATRIKSSGLYSLYIDGVLAAAKSGGTTTLAAPQKISIGSLQTAINYFQGSIDEVRIWTAARTATEISQNMNRSLGGTETNLRNYFRFMKALVLPCSIPRRTQLRTGHQPTARRG